MKKITNTVVKTLLLMLTIGFHTAYAQNVTSQQIKDKLAQHQKKRPQEKIYLHTDRDTYTSGDEVWFKAYLVDSRFHLLINTSVSVYVELIDDQKNIIVNRNIMLRNGVGAGDFQIPYTQTQGSYVIRAYTRYMQNFDAGFFFNKKIKVLDIRGEKKAVADNDTKKQQKNKNNKVLARPGLDLQFFAEGGEMVSQLVNYIAFKAINQQGKGVNVTGKIVDSQGKEVSKFSTVKLGLGKFGIIPKPTEKYTAIATYNNKEYRFELPTNRAKGYVLRTKSNPDNLLVTVQASKDLPLQNAILIAHVRGYTIAQHTHQTAKQAFVLRIPKKQLPSGILHLTLFDAQGKPRSERLAFVENQGDLRQVSISSTKPSYGTRSKASFELSLKDAEGKPLRGNLSMAVVNADLSNTPLEKMNIQNYLWLSSDLKGYIENPAYYFNPQNKDRHRLMDLLMMTQGWRRFKWQEVQQDKLPELKYDYEKGLKISGRLYKFYNRTKPMAGKVKLNFTENLLFNQEVTTDKEGRFAFENLIIADTVNVILQANKVKKRKKSSAKNKIKERNDAIYIKVDKGTAMAANIGNDYMDVPDFEKPIATEQEKKTLERTKRFNTINVAYGLEPDVKLLDEVQITARRIKEKPYRQREGQLYARPSTRLKMAEQGADVSAAPNFFSYISGKLPGVRVMQDGVIIRGVSSIEGSPEPLYLLDGAAVSAAMINDLPLQIISHVDVLNANEAVIYGSQGRNGVLAVYTKQGTPKAAKRPRWGIINYKHPGYYKTREFYVPKYGTDKSLKDKPDYRRILYWQPNVVLSKKGKAKIEFFTSDESANYRVEVEGITLDGKILMGQYRFEVTQED